MWDIFIKSGNTRRTRFTDESKLVLPFRKHDYGQKCLSYLGAKIWNNIDNVIKDVKTCNNFKHKIKDKFFKDIKQREEDIYKYWLIIGYWTLKWYFAPLGLYVSKFYMFVSFLSAYAIGRDRNGNKVNTQLMRYLSVFIPVISF